MLLYNCQQKEYEKKKERIQKMEANEKKKERLIRFSVRVSPKAAKAIDDLQSELGESLSSVLRGVIYEGLKAKQFDATKSKQC